MLDRLPSNAIPWILLAVSAATIGRRGSFSEHVLGYVPCSSALTVASLTISQWPRL